MVQTGCARCVLHSLTNEYPPRNVNWSSSGKWVHLAKVGFEKYFLRKLRQGKAEPFYESLALKVLGIDKLKETAKG